MDPEKDRLVTDYILSQMLVNGYTTASMVAGWIQEQNRLLPKEKRINIIDGRSVVNEMKAANCLHPGEVVLPPLYKTEFRNEIIENAYTRTFSPIEDPLGCDDCELKGLCLHWNPREDDPHRIEPVSGLRAAWTRFVGWFMRKKLQA